MNELPFDFRSVTLAYGQTHAYIHRGKGGVDSFVFDRGVCKSWYSGHGSCLIIDNRRDHGSNPGSAEMNKFNNFSLRCSVAMQAFILRLL